MKQQGHRQFQPRRLGPVAGLLVLAVLFVWLVKTKKGRQQLENMGQHFKFSRELSEKMAICRFAG